jgi:hypothetical protein
MNRTNAHRLLGLAGICLALISCSADPPERLSRRECEELRDHMVALRIGGESANRDAHRAAIRSSLEPFVETCVETITPEQQRCALAAADLDALAICSRGGAS